VIKNIKKFLLLIMMIFLITGCAKINVNMGISDNKEVTLEMIYGLGMDTSQVEDTEDTDIEYEEDDYDYSSEDGIFSEDEMKIDPADYKEMEQYGYKVEEFKEEEEDKKFEGVKLTKTFEDIDDITDSYNEVVFDFTKFMDSEEEAYKKEHNFFYKKGNNYVANFVFDFTSEDDTADDTENVDDSEDVIYEEDLFDEEELEELEGELEELYSTFDLAYTVTLPDKAISHNATSVSDDGKTLTWKFQPGQKYEVKYEFALEKDHGISSIIFIGIGGILVVGIVVGLLLIFSNNKKKNFFGSKKMNGILPTPNVGFNQQPMISQEPVNLGVQPQMMNQPQVMPQQPMGQVMPEPMVQPMNTEMQAQPQMMPQQSMPQQPQMMNQPMNQIMAQQSMVPPQQPVMQQQPMGQPVPQQMMGQQPMGQAQPQMMQQQTMNQLQPQVMPQQPMQGGMTPQSMPQPQMMGQQSMGQPVPQQMSSQQMMSQQPIMGQQPMNQGMPQNVNPNDWK
jgi:hypothetical protein